VLVIKDPSEVAQFLRRPLRLQFVFSTSQNFAMSRFPRRPTIPA
jgi:hypothetical protein